MEAPSSAAMEESEGELFRRRTPWILPRFLLLLFLLQRSVSISARAATDPNDLAVLQAFFTSITANLPWDKTIADPCQADQTWKGIFCTGSRVTQVQLKNMNLRGSLPSSFNQLTELRQLGLQGNSLSGALPSFNGMSKLTSAYLTNQQFSAIPADFFVGLASLQVLSLQGNPLNSSDGGWNLPEGIVSAAASLTTLDLTNSSLSGSIPEFIGNLTSLQNLRLPYNSLSGALPSSLRRLTQLSQLALNNNSPQGLSGPIDAIGALPSLQIVWLHGNSFSGTIPASLGSMLSLQDLRLNDNAFVGMLPWSINGSASLQTLMVQNNKLVGPLPWISNTTSANYVYQGIGNKFCSSQLGVPCDPQLSAILSFIEYLGFPASFVSSTTWNGVDPCTLQGIGCKQGNVTAIVRPSLNLSGTISPYLGNLTYLQTLDLSNNDLTGTIPGSLTGLSFLASVDLSNNNLYGPVPAFASSVKVDVTGNPNIGVLLPSPPPPPPSSTSSSSSSPSNPSSSSSSSSSTTSPSSSSTTSPTSNSISPSSSSPSGVKRSKLSSIIGGVVGGFSVLFALLLGLTICRQRRRKGGKTFEVALPSSSSGGNSRVFTNANGKGALNTGNGSLTNGDANGDHGFGSNSCGDGSAENAQWTVEHGSLVISIQVIRHATRNFSEQNLIGKGGFGSVYKGELHDGTKLAVKKMESSVMSNKGIAEFEAEISVLSKVRHRHLVSLLGYCIQGDERLLVYEYMPMGTLSDHIFERNRFGFPPLSWDRRLQIALDVARGMEYLHGLARESFIHRDLKPSNILLGDDYRAKVSDFGLVKVAPGGGQISIETRLAGTFGYLAPEYAVTGRVTTKSDVFSYGVILMELLTGRKALDNNQPEESMHLVTWFRRQIIGNKLESILEFIDPILELSDEASKKSLLIVAELAGHCTSREAQNRPDMSYVVNVLSPLLQQWKPRARSDSDSDSDDTMDLNMNLGHLVNKWKEYQDESDSMCSWPSLPPRPSGLAQTFSSSDGR